MGLKSNSAGQVHSEADKSGYGYGNTHSHKPALQLIQFDLPLDGLHQLLHLRTLRLHGQVGVQVGDGGAVVLQLRVAHGQEIQVLTFVLDVGFVQFLDQDDAFLYVVDVFASHQGPTVVELVLRFHGVLVQFFEVDFFQLPYFGAVYGLF